MQQDYKTLIIYVLTLFVVVLLIVLKKQQDHLTDLETEVVETEEDTMPTDSLKQQAEIQEDDQTNMESYDAAISEVQKAESEKQ